MRYMVTAAAAALMSAGAAQAAVYQYDLTLERTSLGLDGIFGLALDNEGSFDPFPGVTCEGVDCQGNGDFQEDRFGIEYLDQFEPVISVSLTLDSESLGIWDGSGQEPLCSGPEFVCLLFPARDFFQSDISISSAGPGGFSAQSASTTVAYSISNEGLSFVADANPSFEVDGISYGVTGGVRTSYVTTDLEISPVPLPASLPLLAVGAGAFALFRRRTGRP